MIQTTLIAPDAHINFICLVFHRFAHKLCVGEQRASERHQIDVAARQYLLGNSGCVDAVRCDEGQRHVRSQFLCGEGECTWWHHSGNGGYACFVPTNASVDDGGACFFNFLCQICDFFKRLAVFDQIKHAQSIDDDEIVANCRACLSHNFNWETSTILVRTTPLVAPFVRFRREKFVDQIAFAAHNLTTMIACLARQRSTTHKRIDFFLYAARRQLACVIEPRRDWRFDC
mmetsp:Transcript_2275/g.3770  ORF Transcript_2275/g.3770 Transcript_2275/m.3770 type:complete len:230 (+) Transcript_2275:990-1679(+)